MSIAYHLRAETPGDLPFHEALYASTRQEEMDAAGFPEEARGPFLAMQFNAQNTHYRKFYPAAEWVIIECEGGPAGRLIIDRAPDHHHIIDIVLLPAYRGGGIGTDLLTKICDAARELPVHLFALNTERAIRLYQRLGFRAVKDDGMNTELVWRRAL